jgi:hypothetical protein
MTTIKTIYKKEGATLTKKGRPSRAKTGYMVAIHTFDILKSLDDITLQDYIAKLSDNIFLSNDKPARHYLDIWIHKGDIYVEISRRFTDLNEALQVANFRGEKAIWDVAKQTNIDVVRAT